MCEILQQIATYRHNFSFIEIIRRYDFSHTNLSSDQADEVSLVNCFFSNTGTRLYIPILTRFFWKTNDLHIYHSACKALAAFYVLRRATTTGTAGIDDIFRSCLNGKNRSFSGLMLNNDAPTDLQISQLNDFKEHLKSSLSSPQFSFNLDEKEKWVNQVKGMGHYSNAKFLLRFMLFATHDGAKIDKSDNTLLQRDDAVPDTSTEFLKFQLWHREIYETLEHVAPQNEQSAGWAKVYEDPKLKDTIGNFVLLPKGQNSSLKDSPWKIKKLFLTALLSDSKEERETLVSTHESTGTPLPRGIRDAIIGKGVSSLVKSHMLDGLQNVEEWNADYIRKRSERLCRLVWDKLKPWLD